MQEISFTSAIRPIPVSEFNKLASAMGEKFHAAYPWNFESGKVGADVFTKNVVDCTSCVISDGKRAIMMHLTPDDELNHSRYFLREYLRNNFGLNNPNMSAIVLGSKKTVPSLNIFKNFVELLKDAQVPFSILKTAKTPFHVAYKSNTDTVYISSFGMEDGLLKGKSSNEVLKSLFEKVEISKFDEIA